MDGNRQNAVAIGLAVLLAAGAMLAGWSLAGSRRAASGATSLCARREQEWKRLKAYQPPPTPAQARTVEAELARAEGALADAEAQLGCGGGTTAGSDGAGEPPASRTDAFFDLTGFIRAMREHAGRAGVSLRPDEQFGFSAYVHEGPETNLIDAVHRQRRVVAGLLEALFAARPRKLQAVQRTRPARSPPGAARAAGPASAAEADLFAMDPGLSAEAPGLVATEGYRLTFEAHTPVLRRFLIALAVSELPLLVRSVAVEPVRNASLGRDAPPNDREPLVLLVRPGWSRFCVTVESLTLVVPPGARAGRGAAEPGRAAPPAPARSWVAPPPQARGRSWVYELFTPPSLYYDRRTRGLTAGAESDSAPAADGRFELDLLEVKRGRFRWQLVGYAAGADGVRGIFTDADTGETTLGRAGDQLGGPALTVRSLRLSRGESPADGTATSGTMATAVVADASSGGDIALTSDGPCLAGALRGVFGSRQASGFRREMEEGDSVALNGADYCVERLDLQPARALVARMAPGDGEPLILELTPSSPAPAGSGGDPPTAGQAAGQFSARP